MIALQLNKRCPNVAGAARSYDIIALKYNGIGFASNPCRLPNPAHTLKPYKFGLVNRPLRRLCCPDRDFGGRRSDAIRHGKKRHQLL